ncbi:MAG: metallophosphoesterase [Firmicutes bacterium]|nr:metallophosphoesterase [Bacillota bacterium]
MEKEKEKKKEKSKMKIIIIVILLLIAITFVYMRFIATSGFIIKEFNVTSEKLPKGFNGVKVIHLSDIHYASVGEAKLNKAVEEVNTMKPDIIVFTGDLYDEFSNLTEDMENKIINALSKLNAPLGKYAVSGNHDYKYDRFTDIITKSGFTYLENETKLIYYNDETPIEIIGYPDEREANPNYDIELSDYFKIALIHEGDSWEHIKDKGIDLSLAGHSHGGQVRLPFIGCLIKVDGGKKYCEEHYTNNNSELYVNFGLGETEFKLRSFNKPSINMYRLYTK